MFATGGKCVKFWDAADFKPLHVTPSYQGRCIEDLSFSNDGSCLASIVQDCKEVQLDSVKSSSTSQMAPIKEFKSPPAAICFTNTSPKYLAIAEAKARVLVWDVKLKSCKKSYTLRDSSAPLLSLAMSPNDSHIAVANKAGQLFLLSVSNNATSGPYALFDKQAAVSCLAYSALKRGLVAGAASSGKVKCFDVNAQKVTFSGLSAHSAPCKSVAFSPVNELLMVSAGLDKKAVFYNINSKAKPTNTVQFDDPLTSVTFLHDGFKMVSCTLTGRVLVHDLRTLATPLHSIDAHSSGVGAVALQPVGKSVVGRKKLASVSTKKETPSPALPTCVSPATPVSPRRRNIGSYTLNDSQEFFSPVKTTEVRSDATPGSKNPNVISKNPNSISKNKSDASDLSSSSSANSKLNYSQKGGEVSNNISEMSLSSSVLSHVDRATTLPRGHRSFASHPNEDDEDAFFSPVKESSPGRGGQILQSSLHYSSMTALPISPAASSKVPTTDYSKLNDSAAPLNLTASKTIDTTNEGNPEVFSHTAAVLSVNKSQNNLKTPCASPRYKDDRSFCRADSDDELLSPVRSATPDENRSRSPNSLQQKSPTLRHPKSSAAEISDRNNLRKLIHEKSILKDFNKQEISNKSPDSIFSITDNKNTFSNLDDKSIVGNVDSRLVNEDKSRQVDKENLPTTYPTSPQNSFNNRGDTAPYFDMNVEDFSQDESNESSAEVDLDSHNNIADSSIENIQKLVSDRREKGAALRSASSSHEKEVVLSDSQMERIADMVADKLASRGAEQHSMTLLKEHISNMTSELRNNQDRDNMHLHYVMIEHRHRIMQEMEDMLKKYSLNEDLMQEHMRLQTELNYFRADY